MSVINKIKVFFRFMNEKGVPMPLARDNGKPSFTATLSWISFGTAILGQFGKFAGFLGGIDLTQANYLFLICLGAYLGRKMQGNGKTGEGSLEAPASKDDTKA